MGKLFWVVLCCLGFGLFASVFATYSYEEYRWHFAVSSVEVMATRIKETNEKVDDLLKILREFGEQEKAKGVAAKQEDHDKMVEITLGAIERTSKSFKETSGILPILADFFDRERKTNLRNFLFLVLSLAFTVFITVAAVKTKKRFSKEAAELAKQRDEIGRSNANLMDRYQKLRREQDRLSAESNALEKLRETFEQERRRFRREAAKFQHERQQSGNEDLPADHERDGAVEILPDANVRPATVDKETEAPAATLAPWRFWLASSQNDEGHPLPQEKDDFIAALEPALAKAKLRSLKAERIYKSFLLLIECLEKRQRIGEIGYTELEGWKKWRIGLNHRLFFLRIGEREVRFLPPVPRKDSYIRR